jgi:hypothetical protein
MIAISISGLLTLKKMYLNSLHECYKISVEYNRGLGLFVFNATFNNISAIS